MPKIKLLISIAFLALFSNVSFGQSTPNTASSEFCGKYFTAPKDCETTGNMIKCKDYVFAWIYEPIEDLPRHQKELLAQINQPKKINVSVLGNNLVGYLSKVETYDNLLIIGNVNDRGVIVNLWLNKAIKTTTDLPESVRQFIVIK